MERTVFYGGLYGLAVADALEVPDEGEQFSVMRENSCTGMVGFGHHNQPAGSWSDDTSMTLCVADSLCKDIAPDDMMRKFSHWRGKHFYTVTGVVFDIGRSCRKAIDQYMEGAPAEFCGDSTFSGNGNGALMRMMPVALYQCQFCPGDDEHLQAFLEPIHAASSITHAHAGGLICCGLYSLTLREWLRNTDPKRTLLDIAQSAFEKGKRAYHHAGGEFVSYVNDPKYFEAPATVELNDNSYEDIGAAYYALSVPEEYRKQFIGLGPRRARKLYKKVPHFESSGPSMEERLYRVIKAKYEQHPEEREKLVKTGSLNIIYDTSGSHNNVLGRCSCKECWGKECNNLYGKLLMCVRSEFQQHSMEQISL